MSNQTEYIVGDGSDKGSFLSPVHFVDIPSNAEEAFAKKPVSVKRFSCTGKFLDKLPVFLRESFKIPVFRDELEEYSSSRLTRDVLSELREAGSPTDAASLARELLNLTVGQASKLQAEAVAATEDARRGSQTAPVSARSNDTLAGFFAPVANIWFSLDLKVRRAWVLCYVISFLEGPPNPYVAHLSGRVDSLTEENAALKEGFMHLLEVVQENRGAPSGGCGNVPQVPEKTNIDLTVVNVDPSGISPEVTPMPRMNVNRRPPAPTFTGEKFGTDVITWFGQFEAYSQILNLQPRELVSHASLCLSGRAAKEWALIQKSLTTQGRDIKDFQIFKREMVSQFADAEVETTVRTRLAQLKQTSSVAHYHASFRAIMVEAVTAPVTGSEACSYFRAGLKPKILDRINLDTTIRHEVFNLDVIVRAAKEAEAYLAMAVKLLLERGYIEPSTSPKRKTGACAWSSTIARLTNSLSRTGTLCHA
jgi:hypothetical protein